jgi:hypothetical protein
MNDQVTTFKDILKRADEIAHSSEQHPPSVILDLAIKANLLISEAHRELYQIESELAKEKSIYILQGQSVAKAKALVEATDKYLERQVLKSSISNIEEFIRIAKIQARLKDTEFRGY